MIQISNAKKSFDEICVFENLKLIIQNPGLFVLKGGHQLQCNSICSSDLGDAQKHPEKYKHLIVRIWGWSAYFCELDKEFQDHVIARSEYSL